MSDSLDEIKKHKSWYIFIGVSLLVLTGLTVAVSYYHFGEIGNIVIALIIATLKAALVASIFMHLFWDMFVKMAVIFKVMIFTAVFFAGLMALMLWTMQDVVGKSQYPGPLFRQSTDPAAAQHEGH